MRERSTFETHQFAASTVRTRSVQIKAYSDFCDEFDGYLEPYPCDTDQLCLFICYLARTLCYSSIKNYMSALNNHFRDLKLPAIDYGSYSLKKCLAGIRRVLGESVRQASPLLPPQLLKLFSFMRASLGHNVVHAAMLLCFRSLLRKCHVTASSSNLRRGDFTFHKWGMMVSVRKSKTNQHRDRVHRIPIARVGNAALCAVSWVERHFTECPAMSTSAAFRVPRAGHTVPMSYHYFMSVIKILCGAAGLNPAEFSTHSLRRGGATFLRMCGSSIQEIKERGDWKSDAVYQYLELSVSERLTCDMRVALYLDE